MAAIPYHGDIDLLQNAIRNALLDPQAGDPGTPADGQVWVNSSTWTLKIRLNGVTISLGRLDQISAPTAAVDFNNQRLTNVGTPSANGDAVPKSYADNLLAGAKWKTPEARVTTFGLGNITLSGTQTIDGISVVAGDRVLVAAQTASAENGIYTVAAGAWSRTTDADAWDELVSAAVFVRQGTANSDKGFLCTVDSGGTLGSTSVTWTQFTGGGAYTASLGVFLSGSDFRFDFDDSTLNLNGSNKAQVKDLGIGTGKIANSAVTLAKIANIAQDSILGRVSAGTGVVEELTAAQVRTMIGLQQQYNATVGDGSTTAIAVTHNLGTRDVQVEVYRNSSPYDTIIVPVERTSVNQVTLQFTVAPTTNEFRVMVRA